MSGEDNLERTIGRLEQAIKTLTATWAEQDRKATDGRRVLYDRMGELREGFAEMKAEMRGAVTDIAELKPVVKKLEARDNQAKGAAWAIRLVWGAIAGVAGAIAAKFFGWH
jgi:phage shock protein A